jgi:hypothetical protein
MFIKLFISNRKNNSGIVLIDILLAFSLATLFIFLITESSISSRQVYEKAKERNALLDMYDAGQGSVEIGLYGNERIFENISVASIDSLVSQHSTSSLFLSFIKVLRDPAEDLGNALGTSLCSTDFAGKEHDGIIGSYSYFQNRNASNVLDNLQVSITPITLPIDPLLPLTDLEIRNNTAYISADSSTASDPDLLIVDIHDPIKPKIISKINTGPGLTALVLAGKRIYAAAPSTVGQLHIIRLDSLSNLILENKYKLPLPYATATPALGSSIFYGAGKIFLGTEKWTGQELNIIDVSNPLLPLKIGAFEIGSKINDIYVNGNIAYIADSDQDQLRIIDAHEPSSPILISKFSPSGWQRQEGKSLLYFENKLNFGRTSGGFNFTSDHELFYWKDVVSATTSPSLDYPVSVDIPGGVYGMIRDKKHIFLATRQVDKEFQIFDSDFSTSSTPFLTYSLPVAPQTMTCDGDHIYILAHTAPVIYRVEFGSP